jgi:hypothetical protein
MTLGVRTWGNSPDGRVLMLVGTVPDARRGQRPPALRSAALLVLPPGRWTLRWCRCSTRRLVKDEPGQEAVLDRLLDLLLIAGAAGLVRRPDAGTPAGTGRTATRGRAAPCA